MTAKVFAWLVHLYTAMGLVCAAGAAVLIVRGGDASFRRAFMLMLVATAIDATDGWLARKARVKEVLPRFSGRALDDLVDFQTYTALPLLLLWRADVLPGGAAWVLLAPLLASAYGFSQVDAKTEDGFFLGFPSYWNIVVLYLLLFRVPPAVNAIVLLGLSALVFVRIGWIYPSRTPTLQQTTLVLGGIWTLLIGAIIWMWPAPPRWIAIASLAFPVYYVVLSLVLHARRAPVAVR